MTHAKYARDIGSCEQTGRLFAGHAKYARGIRKKTNKRLIKGHLKLMAKDHRPVSLWLVIAMHEAKL